MSTATKRKATTYGKSSRKRVSQWTSTAAEAFSQASNSSVWDYQNDEVALEGSFPSKSKIRAEWDGSSRKKSVDKEKPLSTRFRSSKTSQTDPPKRNSPSTSIASNELNRPRIHQFASSGEERGTRASSSIVDSSKRRKIAAEEEYGPILVHDDASLQRHVAAEDCEARRLYNRKKTSAIVKLPQRKVRKAKPILPIISLRSPKPERVSNENIANAVDGRSSKSLQTSAQPPRTPPRCRQPRDMTMTPRQNELWNRLLTDEATDASPSHLNLPGLNITHSRSGSPSAHSGENDQDLEQQRTLFGNRRQRIIDTLQSFRTGHGSSDTNSDNNSDDGSAASSSVNCSGSRVSDISVVNEAVSVQTSPSAESQSRIIQPTSQISSNYTQAVQGGSLKITYASQRSYLTDADVEDAAMFSIPVVPEMEISRNARRRGAREKVHYLKANVKMPGEAEDLQGSQGGAMRSIHELREAGGNVRLVGELEAIMDDLDNQALADTLRRTRLQELAVKLQEPSNCRLFNDQGFEGRLLAHVGFGHDLITSSLSAASILLLLCHATSSLLLTQVSHARVKHFLVGLLGFDQDLIHSAKLREFKMSKVAQQEYGNFCKSLLQSTVWRCGKTQVLSCQVLSLQCLEYLARQTREVGFSAEILSTDAIHRIFDTSLPSASPSQQQSLLSPLYLELSLSILDSCSIVNGTECQESLWNGDSLQRITNLLQLSNSWPDDNHVKLRTLTLRLSLNITNNSPLLCEAFSTPFAVSALFDVVLSHFEHLSRNAMQDVKPPLFDNLILSLGCLINLAESSDAVRTLAVDLHQESQSYLDHILCLFKKNLVSAGNVSIQFPIAFFGTNISRPTLR